MRSGAPSRAAIEALRRSAPPDAVLMDIGLPEMGGYAATAEIRRLEGAAARVPVTALSACAMPEDVAACRAAGMDGHLAKPLDCTRLMAELARLLPAR